MTTLKVVLGDVALANLTGDSGNNSISGSDGNDQIDITQGGTDTVHAGAGNDFVFVGATFDSGDRIDGGDGDQDLLIIDGRYKPGLTVTGEMASNFESLQLTTPYDYKLTLGDGVVAAGLTFYIDDLEINAGRLIFNGSAETDGAYDIGVINGRIVGGHGHDTIGMLSFDSWTRVDGGKGFDTFNFSQFVGDGSQDVHFADDQIRRIEQIRFSPSDEGGGLTLSDGNVAAGHTLSVEIVGHSGSAYIDGSAETNGGLKLKASGAAAFTLVGGAMSDVLIGSGDRTGVVLEGGGGADKLVGTGGVERFVFVAVGDSTMGTEDLITSLDDSDHIDLSAIDARTDKAGDQAFTLVSHFTGAAGQLVLTYDEGAKQTVIQGDVDGDGVADLRILIAHNHADFAGFIL